MPGNAGDRPDEMNAIRHEDHATGVRLVLLDRPDSRNAIDASVVAGISSAVDGAPGPVVVVGSTDPRAFSAGADLKLSDSERAATSNALYGLYREMSTSPKVIVAAASGHAVGGGAQLLIASDIRVVSPDVSIRFVGAGHGLVVGAWGLPSLVGRGRAMDLCISMRSVGAEEAKAIGLVDRVVPDPLEAAMDYASYMATLHERALAGIKRVVSLSMVNEALEEESALNASWRGHVPETPK